MSAEAHRPSHGDNGTTPEELALARVLESYLAGLEAGRPADPGRLIAAHPDLAAPLRACLTVMHLAAGLSDVSGPPGGPVAAEPEGAGITVTPASSALTVLRPHDDPSSHLLLPEPPEDDAPIVRIGGDALPDSPGGAGAGRYQVLGEIARGGMGVVLRARDVDLGRDLALKVLQTRHRDDPDMVGRFVEEARIGGQLQHPGIVPVHELGTLGDHRPYFTMKLVKGRTLAAHLAQRPGLETDLTRFLSIFEQVCQTVAYAHARRVVHRDLKPANVMVGSFGEVQVVDWGLAKVLPEGGVADEAKAMAKEETVILSARSGPAGSDGESQPGSVLGTPSYMAPEQARGEINRIDERTDVFGLGAILCEILTGRPPFVGSSREAIRTRAARGELAEAIARLEACGADADLIGVALACLAVEPPSRPRNAGEVALRISAYRAGVQDRLREAELARIEAQTRAEEERKRRRVTVALAASIVGLVLLGGVGWAGLAQQRMERARRLDRASSGVELMYAEARRVGGDLTRWAAAREAARSLEGMLADAPAGPSRERLRILIRDVTQAAEAAEADKELLAMLDDVRSKRAEDPDGALSDAGYADAFRAAGIDIFLLQSAEAAARIRSRPAGVREALASALDQWASLHANSRHDPAAARRLTQIARLADPDPWRDRLRGTPLAASRQEDLRILKEIAAARPSDGVSAVNLQLLGTALENLGDPAGAEAVFREAVIRYPGDVWINYGLAQCLERLGRNEEAIRYYISARSLRPATAHPLGHALLEKGETDQAIAVFRDLTRLKPEDPAHATCLATALLSRGRSREASAILEASIAALRDAIARRPDDLRPHLSLAHALSLARKLDEAKAENREVLRLRPDSAEAHNNLGNNLLEQGKPGEAIVEFREALRLKPDVAVSHYNLGVALQEQGKWEEANAAYREALRFKLYDADAHHNLAIVLTRQGKMEEAIDEYRASLRFKPDSPSTHVNFGTTLSELGKLDEAIAEYREALRLDPGIPELRYNLGNTLSSQGKYSEALVEFRTARDLAEKLKPRLVPNIERRLTETEREASLNGRLTAILAGEHKPADAAEMLALARLCYVKKLYAASARFWTEAFRAQPQLMEDMQAQHRYNAACAAAPAGCGQGKDDPPLDEGARTRWRKQAIDWLKADLAAWKILESGPPQARPSVSMTFQHWKADPDLAGLRDPGSLGKLPREEQDACRTLWKDVDALLAKAVGGATR